jgi:hypothetical protein
MVYFSVVGDPRLADLLKFLLSEVAQRGVFSFSEQDEISRKGLIADDERVIADTLHVTAFWLRLAGNVIRDLLFYAHAK